MALLDQALQDHDEVAAVHAEMVNSYLQGDLVLLQSTAEEQLADLDSTTRDYFIGQGIDARNVRMMESLLPLIEESRVFVAIGALHLPGQSGLINLLRKQGFQMKAEPLPFVSDP